eukprot:6597045-Karenia_brevis.AAC.1
MAEEGSQEGSQRQGQQKWQEHMMIRQQIYDLIEQEDLLEVIVKMGKKGVDYAEDNVVSKAKRDVKKIKVLAEQLH